MFNLSLAYMGPQEWIIIAVVVIVLFGGAKIPQLAKGLGEGIREFKKSVSGDDSTPTESGDKAGDK
jgi:sec-independent protein translocase protein TatA